MRRGALAGLVFAAALFQPAFMSAAQTADAGKQRPVSANATAATYRAGASRAATTGSWCGARGSRCPGRAAPRSCRPSPGAVELPPIKIIQSQPEPPKPAKKAAPAPRRAAAAHSGPPAVRLQRPTRAAPAPAAPPASAPAAAQAETAEQTVAMTPVKGSEIPLDKVPGSVS